MKTPEDVGALVREHRTAAGMSQAELGRLMDMTQATIATIETGTRHLRWAEGMRLRELIGFDSHVEDASIVRDALAYHRILSAIAEREAEAVTL